jgi:hypothetical protein
MGVRTNGRYHVAGSTKGSGGQARLVVVIGALLTSLGLVGVYSTNVSMASIEAASPPRLAPAGGALERFLPSILIHLTRANAPFNTPTGSASTDPRSSPAYVAAKTGLERWLATAALGLATLLFGLEGNLARTSLRTDVARILVFVSLAYAGLSIFETG